MIKLSVKTGDYVMIITGKDKGKTAQIVAINRTSKRALIDGKELHTVIKKAVKARKASDKSGLITQLGSIDVSNLMPICSECNKPTRVGHSIINGENTRMCKKCGAVLVTNKSAAKKATKKAQAKSAQTETVAETHSSNVRRKSKAVDTSSSEEKE
ncbi:MAG: 50S ribosomal protein L24 [Christensenellaceae bacterium]|nr:50S ribosomal protein L24 [Christensenellaceae bacterium]